MWIEITIIIFFHIEQNPKGGKDWFIYKILSFLIYKLNPKAQRIPEISVIELSMGVTPKLSNRLLDEEAVIAKIVLRLE